MEAGQPALGLMALQKGDDRFTDQRTLSAAAALGQRLQALTLGFRQVDLGALHPLPLIY
jgi:hypothetical protein